MAAIYYFIWAAFVWSCVFGRTLASERCPSACECLGTYVDCSRKGLIEIPKDIPSWATNLEIQSNAIQSLQAGDFKGLLSLQKIDLGYNEISTIHEAVFEDVPALRELKINRNKLTELPVLKGNPILLRLELTHNNIHTINASTLEVLRQLDSLDLSNNDIMELSNSTFPANLSITKLYLRNNKIFNFEAGCFLNLTKLHSLKLNKNKISHLPKDIFANMSNLHYLDLSKNQLSKLNGLAFHGLKNLRALKLPKNLINTLEDGVFFGLTTLETLHLDENNITTVSQNWLYGLNNLRELSLSYNSVKNLEPKAWVYAPQLVTLNLNHNEIVTIATDSFGSLTYLKSLLLSGNHIEIIQEEAFKELSTLEELDLSNNGISSTIEDVKGVFSGLGVLTKLNLASNKIKTVTKQAFEGLERLEKLNLRNNNITSIQGNALEPLPQLSDLEFNTTSLFCDCQLSWLPMWLRDRNFEHKVTAKCAHPDTLKGRSIFIVDSNDFKCDGHFPKPIIVMHPKAQVVLKGENVTLNCTAASTEAHGSPTMFQWKKDNKLLTDAVTEDFANRSGNLTHYVSKLHIKKAVDMDTGRYQCVISNEFGAAYSKRAMINVYVYPKFTKVPQNVTAKAGSKATLVCAAEGQPKPTITWQKDGGFDHFPAAQERRMHVFPQDDHFYILNVKAADEGVYSCIASNDAGSITANLTLSVLQNPSFVKPMEAKESKVGSNTVLECLAEGSPQPKLTWFHNGKELNPTQSSPRHFFTAENQLLVIVGTETGDAGEYTCVMSNTLGTVKDKLTLTVIKSKYSANGASDGGGLDNESTTTGIIIIAVVCCVVGTSLVWVIIIYQTRKRQELYSATPTDETTLPGEIPSSGYMSSDKEGSYTHGIPVTAMQAYQYHDMQMKESGYESSSGRFRAARTAAIFPSDVDVEDMNQGYCLLAQEGHYVEQSDENSLSSHEYPRSDTDSLKSEANSVNSSQSSRQQVLSTFHPQITTGEPGQTGWSRSCSGSQTLRDNRNLSQTCVNREPDTDCVDNTDSSEINKSVTPRVEDSSEGQSYGPCDKDTLAVGSHPDCKHCGTSSPCNRDTQLCQHNSPPLPPKPSRLRQARRKEHTHFDRAQPPGLSHDQTDGQDCIVTQPVYDDNIPPPPPLVPCSSLYVRPEYSPQNGLYVQTNGVSSAGATYVPVYHPMNTPPCDCHLHYAPQATHKLQRDGRSHKVDTNNSTNLRNQRLNGVIGCMHHVNGHMNGMNPSAWHGHAYTLPYMPSHHLHQIPAIPAKVSPPRPVPQQTSPRHKEQHNSLPRQQNVKVHSSSSLKGDKSS